MTEPITLPHLQAMKAKGEKIAMATCYDFSTAKLVDRSEIDGILVGDSLGMTMLGYENTLPVTMDDMITFGRSVVRGAPNTFVMVDMPFMSYQVSVEQALTNAGRLMKETGCHCVKLEGGKSVADRIHAIVECGIPVCAHIGMTPQSVNAYGGFKVQGRGEANAQRILEDALAIEAAGANLVVLECIPPKLAGLITKSLSIPTIGIGAGPECDGQILVSQDLLGMNNGFAPKIMKRFANVGTVITDALNAYSTEVRETTFPTVANSFPKSDCDDAFLKQLEDLVRV